jgi:uncharacterized repeat protein (TIGR01451 family)
MRKSLLTIGMGLAVSSATVLTSVAALPAPYGSTFTNLNGGNPNGAWEFYVQDDTPLDSGTNYGGWILSLTLASPVIGVADNQLLMTSVATNVPFGSNIVYTLSVTNYGPSPATNVFVSDTLPSGVTFVSATNILNMRGTVSPNATQLTWNNIGTLFTNAGVKFSVLTNNEGATLTLTVLPGSSGSFVNSALVSASTPDPNPDDVTASLAVTVGNGGAPSLTNTVVNSNGTFQLTVNGQSGQEYIVQASTNLINWVPVYTNPSPFVSPFTFTDSNASSYLDRFYRVITGP